MKTANIIVALVFAGLFMTACVEKQVYNTLIDSPEGRIYFQTASPYEYKDIYDGIDNDKKAVIHGDLEIPAGTVGEVPAVVFFHGSGGVNPKHLKWINRLHDMGIATFRVDSFSGRGISSLVGKQENLPHPAMMVDAYKALNLLFTHPRIDKNKIGVMGGSKGGTVAVYTAYKPVWSNLKEGNNKFAFHVGVYPFCQELENVSMTGAPILILIGEKDDWTPVGLCENFSKLLNNNGYDIQLNVYPDAHHSFDSDHGLSFNENAYNFENCDFIVLEEGITLEQNSNIKMDTRENRRKALSKCMKRGCHTGGNSSVTKIALNDMEAFIKDVIR